jgi:8-oxo-dGTP pyrophosphatase MutT (NUDIX family)
MSYYNFMKTRIQARVLVFDSKNQSILIVRNPGAKFWYVPGGGMEDGEDILQCAVREMEEETGLQVDLKRLLYAQELHDDKDSILIIELFWLADLRIY